MSQQLPIEARIIELLAEGKTGPQIAAALYQENFSHDDAASALRQAGFEVCEENGLAAMGIYALHISVSAPADGRKKTIYWFPRPTRKAKPAASSHLVKATRVKLSLFGLPYVDVWIGEKLYPSCRSGYPDPSFVEGQMGALVEDAEGWLRIWWNANDVEPADKK